MRKEIIIIVIVVLIMTFYLGCIEDNENKNHENNKYNYINDINNSTSNNISLSGKIYDISTNESISNATIIIELFTNTGLEFKSKTISIISADENGDFSIELDFIENNVSIDLPYEEYRLIADHRNFLPKLETYGYKQFSKVIDFYLEPSGIYSGIIYDNNGNLISNASVGLYNEKLFFIDINKTGIDGKFLIEDIPLGTYSLIVSKKYFNNIIIPKITFNKWDEIEEEVTLNHSTSNITVKGNVTYTAENEYIKLIFISEANKITVTTTDKLGYFDFSLFLPGYYNVTSIPFYGQSSSSRIDHRFHIDWGINIIEIQPGTVTP